MRWLLLPLLAVLWLPLAAQTDTTDSNDYEEEDWDIYADLDFADEGTKRFCTSKITNLSPSRLISIGYELQGPAALTAGAFQTEAENYPEEEGQLAFSHGLRLQANVPVISRNSIIIQLNANYMESRYNFDDGANLTHPLQRLLADNGLRTAGLGTTIFKPLNETNFILFQGSADLNGDYGWSSIQPLSSLKYSAALLYGWKTSDRFMWGIGASRTYRVGELNYVPVLLLNWTSRNGKWGTELLLPARGHLRRTFNPRSIALFGFELEGQSYRLNNRDDYDFGVDPFELRRGELRIRLDYQRAIKNFNWLGVQVGYRYNWTFEVDELEGGNEFFRGFFGEQPFAMENMLANTFYVQLTLNLVSP